MQLSNLLDLIPEENALSIITFILSAVSLTFSIIEYCLNRKTNYLNVRRNNKIKIFIDAEQKTIEELKRTPEITWNSFVHYLNQLFMNDNTKNTMQISLYKIKEDKIAKRVADNFCEEYKIPKELDIPSYTEFNEVLVSNKTYFNNNIKYYMDKGHQYNNSYYYKNNWNAVWCMPIKNNSNEIIGFLNITFLKSLREDVDFAKIEKNITKKIPMLLSIIESS